MALLQIVPRCTLPIKTLMSPGSCCMCGLPVRDHTTHLCVQKTKTLVTATKEKQPLSSAKSTTPEPSKGKLSVTTATIPPHSKPRTDSKPSVPLAPPAASLPVTPNKPVLPLIVEGSGGGILGKAEVVKSEHGVKEEISPTVTGEVVTGSAGTTATPAASTPATPEVAPDVQLWLNTMSRSPLRRNEVAPPPTTAGSSSTIVKTIAQHSPTIEFTTTSGSGEREHKQAELKSHGMKIISKLSERQNCLKDRLEALARRLLRIKTVQMTGHILTQLDLFDHHALSTQVELNQQLPCNHKLECGYSRATHRSTRSEPPVDGHAFSTMEKLRVSIGVDSLHSNANMLSCFDDETTESSSDEDELESISEQSLDRTELSAIEQKWEQERAQIAAQWTWVRGQFEDLQHRMRRESDVLQVIREKKEKVSLLHNDHVLMGDKYGHHHHHHHPPGGMIPPALNGYHNHPSIVMKNNFKYEMSRVNQEMYLKSNQHKRLNKSSKIDGNTCARTRPLASILKRMVVRAKPHQTSITPQDFPLRCGALGKVCCRRNRRSCPGNGDQQSRPEAGFHPVLSKRNESHINVHLIPLLSSVDYYPSERKHHILATPPTFPGASMIDLKAEIKISPLPVSPSPLAVLPPVTTPSVTTVSSSTTTSLPALSTPPIPNTASPSPLFTDVPCITTTDQVAPKKRGFPAATVEHMVNKKYRPSMSQPGSRAASPIHMDKRKKPNQFDIHNIEVDFSVVAPARIEKPRYKEIEIPKCRIITDDLLNEMLKAETDYYEEEDTTEAYEALHSRCEQLEKVRFINMTINATGRTDLYSELQSVTPSNKKIMPSSSVGMVSRKSNSPCPLERRGSDSSLASSLRSSGSSTTPAVSGNITSRTPSHRRSESASAPSSHVFDEEVKQRTRASKHTSDYPTAVS